MKGSGLGEEGVEEQSDLCRGVTCGDDCGYSLGGQGLMDRWWVWAVSDRVVDRGWDDFCGGDDRKLGLARRFGEYPLGHGAVATFAFAINGSL